MTVYTPQTVLVTGGAGFIGSNFIRYLLAQRPDVNVVNYDALTYAGNLENLAGLEQNGRYRFVKGDIRDGDRVLSVLAKHGVDTIINFAAESHVDRSILSGAEFVSTNVGGTQVMLDVALRHNVSRFLQISTDEVYGSLGETGLFTEESPLAPNSPYSASKTSADLFCRAYHHTFGLPVMLTRCSNNYGPYQFPEKLIPLMIIKALNNEELPVYGDGMNVRDWIHVDDHSSALLTVLEKGTLGEVYNVGADNEWPNIDIVKKLLELLDRPESLIRFVKDRPGHDRRYAIDSGKITSKLGWRPLVAFGEGLETTVRWYLDNRQWWQRVMSGEYMDFYQRNYADKLAQE